MNLRQQPLGIQLGISLLLSLYVPCLFPSIKIHFFSPFLIVVFYNRPLMATLWTSLFCGLFLDAFNSSHFVPLHGIAFALTSRLLYSLQRNFFADTLSTLPIMTFLYSVMFTVIFVIINHMYEEKLRISIQWVATDLIVMPIFDVLYACVFFMLPAFFFGRRQLKGKDYFLS